MIPQRFVIEYPQRCRDLLNELEPTARERRLVGSFSLLTLVANSGALIGEADRPFPGVNKRREEEPNVVTPR